MTKFEAVVILSPEISSSNRKNLSSHFVKLIEQGSGKIVSEEDWGLRDLAYNLGNFSKAFYNFFQIEIDGKNIDDIKKNLSQNEDFLRHLFIKVTNHQELPTKLCNEKK